MLGVAGGGRGVGVGAGGSGKPAWKCIFIFKSDTLR